MHEKTEEGDTMIDKSATPSSLHTPRPDHALGEGRHVTVLPTSLAAGPTNMLFP